MATELSLQKAAQAWCTEKTKHLKMNIDLAEAFAEILDEIWSKPWLGNATTNELVSEIGARVSLSELGEYKTTGDNDVLVHRNKPDVIVQRDW